MHVEARRYLRDQLEDERPCHPTPAGTTYDVVREEVARSDPEGTSSDETLRAFEAVCEAMDTPAPGTLTVVYERHSEGFD